jgi:hypothetical protein
MHVHVLLITYCSAYNSFSILPVPKLNKQNTAPLSQTSWEESCSPLYLVRKQSLQMRNRYNCKCVVEFVCPSR